MVISEPPAAMHPGLASVVGEARVITDPAVCAGFDVNGVIPRSVVYPRSATEVAEVLRCAATHHLAVIPCRNGTKLDIGSPPRAYDVALSLKDMNQVWYYEPDDLVVSVEPGMKFGDLQHFLARHRLWIPLDPAGGERASVGGILAANAAGLLRLHYGGPRDMVLGMKIATTDGKIVKTGGRVVKNVAGYDLAKLLIGSYGTLGVIVEATFKLYPQIATRATWVVHPGTLAQAREIRRELLRSPLHPLRMVLLNLRVQNLLGAAESGAHIAGASRESWTIWIEAGGSDPVIARYSDELGSMATKYSGALERIETEAAAEIWGRISDFGLWLARERQIPVVVKAAMPIAVCEEFLERAEAEAKVQGYEVAGLVQLGVGVVELGLATLNPESRVLSPDFLERLRRIAVNLRGSLVVTRCPAELKSKIDVWGPTGDDFEAMRKLKALWDPKSTLAPGRFVGGL